MLSIQDAGIEILGDNPRSFYIFCGSEYGVKSSYLDHLRSLYSDYIELDTVQELTRSFERKSLVPIDNTLYVCRYDFDFLKVLDDKQVKKFNSYHIPGCLVLIYSDDKSFNKCNKYFEDNTIRFDEISPLFVTKYLISDFPNLDKHYIQLVVPYCYGGYGQAKTICSQLDSISGSIRDLEDIDILRLFALERISTEDQFSIAIASRNFNSMMSIIDSFEGDYNYLLNHFCFTMMNIDKLMDKKNSESPLSRYVKLWTRQDVYYMFSHAYNEMVYSRSYGSSRDIKDALVWMSALVKFSRIPSSDQLSYR